MNVALLAGLFVFIFVHAHTKTRNRRHANVADQVAINIVSCCVPGRLLITG